MCPRVYWSVVVVISVFGTLITDNLTDRYNVPLTTSTPIFAVILAAVFAVWYAVERTLSIHTIVTTRREAFYWLAILFTFALGTAAGDLVAEKFTLGYGRLDRDLRRRDRASSPSRTTCCGLNAVLSSGSPTSSPARSAPRSATCMSQNSHKYGGLGLGTTGTSYIFLGCILALVTFLTITKRDQTPPAELEAA